MITSHLLSGRARSVNGGVLAATLLASMLMGCDGFDGSSNAPETSAIAATGIRPATGPLDADGCLTGTQTSGATYQICVGGDGEPSGTLAVYAHGYVFPQLPLAIPQTEAGIDVRGFLLNQGFDYAATSFHANGLITPAKGVKDLHELVVAYRQRFGQPEQVLLFSVSNGALIGTLAMEQHPNLFDGAFASCAPVGDFTAQVSYLGDMLVLFQHYFPGVIPGDPTGIPADFIEGLVASATAAGVTPDLYLGAILTGVLTNPANFARTGQILSILAHTPEIAAAFASPTEGISTLIRGIIYNTFATNNAVEVLGGAYFDNADRTYVGSPDDGALNAAIARYSADANARAHLRAFYDTRGSLTAPVIALHTLRDPTVPFWQATRYGTKLGADASWRTLVPLDRYGHCTFQPDEIADGLAALLAQL